MTQTPIRPRAPIRRFDVFAEYNRLQALQRGLDPAHAKGYGLWVAKVVASGGGRRGGKPSAPPAEPGAEADRPHERPAEQPWHVLGDEPQTDALFDHEIVQRMGADFYVQTFAPAIAAALAQGQRYENIRDSIRRDWSPAQS
ncbi:MAG TPA: hypothetical protein VFQ25_07090 [Ktedonobacterales bacterium]|nr:hypothetical protein [Ktedonobacterales bacterium]